MNRNKMNSSVSEKYNLKHHVALVTKVDHLLLGDFHWLFQHGSLSL